MSTVYVGTVWYVRTQQAPTGLWYEGYTRKILHLTASSVDDFKQQVRLDTVTGTRIEFGPVGVAWSQRGRY